MKYIVLRSLLLSIYQNTSESMRPFFWKKSDMSQQPLGHSFFSSVADAEVILDNGDLQTNDRNSKTFLVYLDSVNCMLLFYISVAVEPDK